MIKKGLTGYQLKWIAIITMTLDHVYKVFGVFWLPKIVETTGLSELAVNYILLLVFGIGSITMCVFAWLIGEGCRYTHNIKAYIGRLLLFGLLSEIPFQLMVAIILQQPLSLHFGFSNIMATFALGAIACYGYQTLKEKGQKYLCFLAPILCAAIAYFLHTDYDVFGVLTVFICYVVKDKKARLTALAGIILFFRGIVYPIEEFFDYGFAINAIPYFLILLIFSLLSVLFLSAYNGQRGRQAKYIFYGFYPLHMMAIVLLYLWITR